MRTAVVLLLACVGIGPARLVAPQTAPSREARWQEDLTCFAGEFERAQKDFGTLYPRAHFDRQLSAIRQMAPSSPDAEVVLALMRLVAGAGVAHTTIRPPQGALAFHRLPIGLGWYADGLAVTSAAEAYRAALGTRVVRVGSMTPEALEAAAAPYISHENDSWLHQQSPALMVTGEFLQHLKLVDGRGRVPITLAGQGGSPFTLDLPAMDPGPLGPLVSMYDALSVPPALYRKQPQRFYWYEYLPDSQALYIQYNRCRDDPALAFAEFTRQLLAFADAHVVQRTIVDLRLNQGGDSSVVAPLLDGLAARGALVAPRHLYTIIGRATFSSGVLAAVEFRDRLHAVLVGEPAGEQLNSYGEVRTLTLPNSRLEVQYTVKFFRLAKDGGPRALALDVPVTRTLADPLTGRDPSLDAALRHPLR